MTAQSAMMAMVVRILIAAALFLTGVLTLGCLSCGSRARHAIDLELQLCVPPRTLALAGVNLDRLRSAPLYAKLPPSARTSIEAYGRGSYVLGALDGKEILTVTQGDFGGKPPEGAALLTPRLAVAGSGDAIRAATSQHGTGTVSATQILTY